MRKTAFRCMMIPFVGAFLAVAGCENDDDDGHADGPSVTGSWAFVALDGQAETMNLAQEGDAITGDTGRGGVVTGSADGARYDIRIAYPTNYILRLDVTYEGDALTGTAIDSLGRSGDIVATRVEDEEEDPGETAPVAGLWSGTYSGGNGFAVLVTLGLDGSVRGSSDTAGNLTGSYTLTGTQFTSTVTTEGGEQVESSGALDGNVIAGTWSSNHGSGGSFTLTRQQLSP